MTIHDFVSQFSNHPILFVGTGMSLRYLKNSYTWDSLLSKIALELYGSDEKYLDIKASCKDEHGNFLYNEIATIIEKDFNEYLMLPNNRNGKFKDINDIYYDQMRTQEKHISRFKIYLSRLLNSLDIKEDKQEELMYLRGVKNNICSIITTNYDKFIENVFQFNPLIGNDILLSNSYGSVYKIHGCIDSPDKMIITSNDYDEFSSKYELIRAQLLSLFIHHPIIFIGYRIQDDNIKKILKTIFSYVEPNSELANKIRSNFLLVEYEESSQNTDISDFDVDIDGFPTIRIHKIKTDNFLEIYKALASIHLPITAMDIKKVQTVIGDIVKGNSGIRVNIIEDINSLHNDQTVLFIGKQETFKYAVLYLDDFIAKYFKFIEESDYNAISLIDNLNIPNNSYFPIHGFARIKTDLKCIKKLKKQQVDLIRRCLQRPFFNRCKIEHSSISEILNDNQIAKSYKDGAILWNVWNDKIAVDELKKYLIMRDDVKITSYRWLLCAYDYKKYKD